jgi:hypothetical protein
MITYMSFAIAASTTAFTRLRLPLGSCKKPPSSSTPIAARTTVDFQSVLSQRTTFAL